jgi:hypothetical protein
MKGQTPRGLTLFEVTRGRESRGKPRRR